MTDRPRKVTVRLSEAQHAKLKNRVHKSRLSQEAYLRQIIDGLVPQDAPPVDYYAMTRELNSIGNNLNQIAYVANATGNIDRELYVSFAKQHDQFLKELNEAMVAPKKAGK